MMTSVVTHHIHTVEQECRELRDALDTSRRVLQQIIDPEKFQSSSQNVWAQAVMAEAKARAVLRREHQL